MTPIHKTLQNGKPEPLGLLPWLYTYEPGQIFVVEYKEAGKVVRTETWKLVEGEEMRRWDRQS